MGAHPRTVWQPGTSTEPGQDRTLSDIFDLFGDGDFIIPDPPAPTKRPAKAAPPERPAKAAPPPVERPADPPCGPPAGRVPAEVLPCGHMNWNLPEVNAAARERGSCCANPKGQVFWEFLRGEYIRPIPVEKRRTQGKGANGGFPGYCTDDAGYYIGGIGNNCHYYGVDERRCVVHRKAPLKDEAPAVSHTPPEEPEAVDLDSMADDMPKTGMSWKQRQMLARKR